MSDDKSLENLRKRYEKLDAKFESLMDEYLGDMELSNVTIKKALMKQVTLELVFGDINSKAKSLFNDIDGLLEDTQAELTSNYLKNSYDAPKIQEAKTHALASRQFRDIRELHVLIKGLTYDTATAYDTVVSRKFILNNLSSLIIASSESTIL